MLAYNQAPFIRQALDSVLMQKREFPIEICIGEDGSCDGTREICREYAERYPDMVRLFLRDRRNPERARYSPPFAYNGAKTFEASRGKYIAMLEGDDYWTDPLKLQRQVDLLEDDDACMVCFHAATECRGGEMTLYRPPIVKSTYSSDDLFRANFIRTCTVMHRNVLGSQLPDWFRTAWIGDWVINILHAVRGAVRYIDEPMACYRVHEHGYWGAGGYCDNLERMIRLSKIFMREFPETVHKNIPKQSILESRCDIVRYCLVWGNRPFYGRTHLLKALLGGAMPAQDFSQFLRLCLWSLLPWGGMVTKRLKKERSGRLED